MYWATYFKCRFTKTTVSRMNSGALESENTPLVSVILPVFNAEKYITEAVQSILNQTFVNFELILIDGGSTDGTLKLLERFKKIDNRIVLISYENMGLVDSLNEGVIRARGTWLARMDGDDIALPNRFERQLQWLEKTESDICGSWVQYFGAHDKRILKHSESHNAIKIELLFCCALAHPTVMMKAEMIKALRYNKLNVAEDYDLWIRAVIAGWKFTNIPEVLLMYRQSDLQISKRNKIKLDKNFSKLQRQYWLFSCNQMKISCSGINAVCSLMTPFRSKDNLAKANSCLSELLRASTSEGRQVVLQQISKLYLRSASLGLVIPLQWYRLNRIINNSLDLKILALLLFLSIFRIESDGKVFQRLKRFYLCLIDKKWKK